MKDLLWCLGFVMLLLTWLLKSAPEQETDSQWREPEYCQEEADYCLTENNLGVCY